MVYPPKSRDRACKVSTKPPETTSAPTLRPPDPPTLRIPDPRPPDPPTLRTSEPPNLRTPDPPTPRPSEPPNPRPSEPPNLRTPEPPNLRTPEPPTPEPPNPEPPNPRTPDPPNPRTSEPRTRTPEPPNPEPPNLRTPEPPNPRTSEPPNLRTPEPPNLRTPEPPNPEPPNPRTPKPPTLRPSEPPNPRTPPEPRTPEPPNPQTPEPPNPRTSEPPNPPNPRTPNLRTPEPPNLRTPEPPNLRTPEPPNPRTPEPPNPRTPEPPNPRTPNPEPPNPRTPEPPTLRTPEPPNPRTPEPPNLRTPEPPNPRTSEPPAPLLSHLLQVFREHPSIVQLSAAVQSPEARIQLTDLREGHQSFVLSATAAISPSAYLVICRNKEEAAYLENDIEGILGLDSVAFFPDSFKRPATYDAIKAEQVRERARAVSLLSAHRANPISRPFILVTYPEALFEKVVNPDALDEGSIEVQVGEKLDVETMMEVLIEYGFERTDFVLEPGQFSLRGGIVDLFSYGSDLPYRIELFDDEVESIRLFDPMSQLSQRNISRVRIVPNLNTKFKREQKQSLLGILPEKTLVWVQDFQGILERLQYCFERVQSYAEQLSAIETQELREVFRDQAFVYPVDVVEDLKTCPIVLLEQIEKCPLPITQTIDFKTSPQPSFNKQFELLINHLRENQAMGYDNYIFSENPKQIDRLTAILTDLKAQVTIHPVTAGLKSGFIDHNLKIACLTDHQIFQRFHAFKLKTGKTQDRALQLRMLRDLQPGDYVTHIDHGIGRFSGLEKINIGGQEQEAVRIFYKNNDILYVSIHSLHKISRYVGKEGTEPVLNKLGSDAWQQVKNRTKKRIKDIAAELIKLYAARRASKGHAYPPDSYLQNELEASFLYEDTPDQFSSTQAVKEDMEKPYPMDRLVCGDVGFGKTEVAIRAAFKAVCDGKQVAILVPTTILALQHFRTFRDRLSDFPVTVDYINRFRSTKEKKQIFADAKIGKVDILIGTHGILSKELQFKDLGLLIIDEEQKFGVKSKEKLREMQVNVDTLTLTATPIPRTLQFSLMAARDLSVIRTPPPNRQPIHTEIRVFDQDLIKDAIYYEVYRGGQVFFVHNRVSDLSRYAEFIRKLCPDLSVAMAHGQMEADSLEQTLVDFIDRKHEVLVCTNIIETGLDIPTANTILIHRAEMFGLSDLHQLRGRVGRSNVKAYCYLLAPPLSTLTNEARKRLRTIEDFSDLGDGFNVAMRDLDIRGAGNLLGGEQSGFISEIGFETYQKILDEAIQDLKETDFKDLFAEEVAKKRNYVRDVSIETDIEMRIPDSYVSSTQERMSLYTQIDEITDEEGIEKFTAMLTDRFGSRLPKAVFNLYDALRLRWICKRLGFDRLVFKGNKLRLYFISDPQSPFYETAHFQAFLQFVQKHGRQMGLAFQQTKRDFFLVQEEVRSVEQAKRTLELLEKRLSEWTMDN
jgi:transcription-repair coupling factor (superfamily II helicase)